MAGQVRVRGQGGCSNPIPVAVPDFWLSGKTRTCSRTRSTWVLPIKVGTDSDGYPRVRVFLPCLVKILGNIRLSYSYQFIVFNASVQCESIVKLSKVVGQCNECSQ